MPIQMMMDWLGRKNDDNGLIEIANSIDKCVADHLRDGKNLTYDLGGTASCSQVGESIAKLLNTELSENH